MKFDSYRLWYGYWGDTDPNVRARISCHTDEGPRHIFFYENDAPEVERRCAVEGENTVICLPISRFLDVYTILLNEKPLAFVFKEDECLCWIQTIEEEPIGEQEPQT